MTASFPFESVATAADLKRVNRQKILQTLRSGNAMTVSDIHDKTGISRITVMRALQDYCNRGIVKSQGGCSKTMVPYSMKKQSLEAAKAATQALFFGRIDV